jgi:N-methylhydantoinase B/oxoprolinase/acetone carboxylase alpha subunit
MFGGADGIPGSILLNPGTEREESLPSKIPYRKVVAGDTVRMVGPSAGGYGDPRERDPEAIRRDVADGYLTEETARRQYPQYR